MSYLEEKLNLKVEISNTPIPREQILPAFRLGFEDFDRVVKNLSKGTFDNLLKYCRYKAFSEEAVKGDGQNQDQNLFKRNIECQHQFDSYQEKIKELRNFAEREYNNCFFNIKDSNFDEVLQSRDCKKYALKSYFRSITKLENEVISNVINQYI